MVHVGLEDVGGHLSVVTDVMLDLLKLLFLRVTDVVWEIAMVSPSTTLSFFPQMSP